MNRLCVLLCVVIAAGWLPTACAGPDSVTDLPQGRVWVGERAIPARIAADPEARALGFQHADTRSLTEEAIYFRFPAPVSPSFHMRNVAGPLVIAWIGPDHRIIGVTRMAPGSTGHRPPKPVTAALEVAPERAEALGLHPGVEIRPAAD